MRFEEGDKFRVRYGDGDTWVCPICGYENLTPNYDSEEMSSCENCRSRFEVYTVQEVVDVNDEAGASEHGKIQTVGREFRKEPGGDGD